MNIWWITFDSDEQLNYILDIIRSHNDIIEYPITKATECIIKQQYKLQPGSRVLIMKQYANRYISDTDVYIGKQLMNIGLHINLCISKNFISRLDNSSKIVHEITSQ